MERSGPLDAAVGQAIADLRVELDLTQQQVWTQLGMSKTGYRDIEQQRRAVPLEVIRQVASILDSTATEIVRRAERIVEENEKGARSSNPHAEKLGRSLGFP